MARTVRHVNLETRTARARLKRGRNAHWQNLITGKAHLGYQRDPGPQPGRWLLRQLIDGKYSLPTLALADDVTDADGREVHSYEQAKAAGLAIIDAPKAKRQRLTVRQGVEDYITQLDAQGRPTGDTSARARAHIYPTLGDKPVAELTAERLRRWQSDLAASPALKRTARGARQQYKAEPEGDEAIRKRRASANRVATILKAALNHAFT